MAHLDEDVRQVLAQVPDVEVWSTRNGLPSFVSGALGRHDVAAPAKTANLVAAFYRLTETDLSLDRESTDASGAKVLRFNQVRNGLPVVGAMLKVGVAANGIVETASGDVRGGGDLDARTDVTSDLARSIATQLTGKPAHAARLVYRATETGPRLAWEVAVERELIDAELVYISAKDRRLIDRLPQAHSGLARGVYSLNDAVLTSINQLPGTGRRGEGWAPTGDSLIDTNYNNLGRIHQCFAIRYGRDSWNGAGAGLVSTVHLRLNQAGTAWNAFWMNDRNQMVYGNDTPDHRSAVYDIDVTAHEIGHGLTNAESRLQYLNESGAINEGLSDVQGAVCDRVVGDNVNVYAIGEDVWTKNHPGDALRYMWNPTADGVSRDFYPERYIGGEDNGGVHVNSGIVNLAFYLTAEGGHHPRGRTANTVTGIGLDKAAWIFYVANVDYLTPTSNFSALRAATIKAARRFWPRKCSVPNPQLCLKNPSLLRPSAEERAITGAWTAVGVF